MYQDYDTDQEDAVHEHDLEEWTKATAYDDEKETE